MTIRDVAICLALCSICQFSFADDDSDADSVQDAVDSQFEMLDADRNDRLDASELQRLPAAELNSLRTYGLPAEATVSRDAFLSASLARSTAAVTTPTDAEAPARDNGLDSGRDGPTSPGVDPSSPSNSTQPNLSQPGTPGVTILRNSTKRSHFVPELPSSFGGFDKNGDGQIALYEWDRKKYSEFAKLDKNGDGFLTPVELLPKDALKTLYSSATTRLGVLPAGSFGMPAAPGVPGAPPGFVATPMGGADPIDIEARNIFVQMDDNKDGSIDESDWGRSRRIRPWFESAGVTVSLPLNADTFVANYRRAKESSGR